MKGGAAIWGPNNEFEEAQRIVWMGLQLRIYPALVSRHTAVSKKKKG